MADLQINRRLIMTPGPTLVDPRVSQAMSNQILGQFDPDFTDIMDHTMALIRKSFSTNNQFSFPIDGSSRAGLEAVIGSIVEPGDDVLVPIIGRFGDLAVELAQRAGGNVHTIETDWGQVLDQDQIIAEIKRLKPKVVAMVHGETSTGRLQPLDRIGKAVRQVGGFLVIDCVASYMGTPVLVDDWQIDAAVGGAQKCLSVPAGITPITFNDRFAEAINQRKRIERGVRSAEDADQAAFITSNYLDLTQLQDYWSPRRLNHHTEATVSVYGLNVGLQLALEEGLENRYARHLHIHRALNAGLTALGLHIFNEGDHEMPMVTCVEIPASLGDGEFFKTMLLKEFGVEISSSFGSLHGKIWRIGTMGYVAEKTNMVNFIALLAAALLTAGVNVDTKAGLAAFNQVYSD